jgi:hypothetical protein
MGIHYTGVFEMLGNGLGFGILFGLEILAVAVLLLARWLL